MSKSNHKNKIRKEEKVIVLDGNSIIVYIACIIFLFLIGRFFIIPLKTIAKIIGNSILGGILIFVVNLIGEMFGFHIGLNVGTALITGILGIPRCYFINTFKGIYRIRLKNNKKDSIIRKILKGDLFMEYKQVKQTSRPYEYGEGKEFGTREEALEEVGKVENNLKTDMVLIGIYKISEVKILEESNAFQIVVITKIPQLLGEKEQH